MLNRYIKILVILLVSFLGGLSYYLPYTWDEIKQPLKIEALKEKNPNSQGFEVWIQEIEIDGKKIDLQRYQSEGWELKYDQLVAYQELPTIFEAGFNVGEQIEITVLNHPRSGTMELTWGGETTKYDLYNDVNTSHIITLPKVGGVTGQSGEDLAIFILIVAVFGSLYYLAYRNSYADFWSIVVNILATNILTYIISYRLLLESVFSIVVIHCIIFFVMLHFITKLVRNYKGHQIPFNPLWVICNLIFTMLLLISLRFNTTYFFVTSIGEMLLAASLLIILTLIIIYIQSIMLSRERKLVVYSDKQRNKILKHAMIILSLSGLVYLIAFYPGFMTSDSVDQWGQMLNRTFYDAHPVIHTLFNTICTWFWKSPAAISLVQIIIFNAICIYGIKSLLHKNISKVMIYSIVWFYALNPMFMLMNVTLWKDVMYSNMIFLFTIFLLNIYASNFEWLKSKKNCILFIFIGLGTLLFRHNGMSVVLGTCVIMLLFNIREWKRITALFALIFGFFYVIIGPVYNYFGIEAHLLKEKKVTVPYDSMKFHNLAYVITNNGDMTEEEYNHLEEIVNIEELLTKYSKYHVLNMGSLKVDKEYLIENSDLYIKMYQDIQSRNKELIIENILNTKSYLWEFEQPKDGYLNLAPVNVIYENKYGLEFSPLSERLNSLLTEVFRFTRDEGLITFIWRPVCSLFILGFCATLLLYKSGYKALVVLVPVMSNWAGIVLTVNFQDFRYLYSVFLVLPIIFAWCVQQNKTKNN